MGWNLRIASELAHRHACAIFSDSVPAAADTYEALEKASASFSRAFSYELHNETGRLARYLTDNDWATLALDLYDQPLSWRLRDARLLASLLHRIRTALEREVEPVPLYHSLWYTDAGGHRRGGMSFLYLPTGGIAYQVPHGPIVKLDGGHRDWNHRHALRKYEVHIDADLLAQYRREEAQYRQHLAEQGTALGRGPTGIFDPSLASPRTSPLVERAAGWVQVEATLTVLGSEIEVESVDAQSVLHPELVRAESYCRKAAEQGMGVYWLLG